MIRTDSYKPLQEAYEYMQTRLPYAPRVAMVLGSGLGRFADRVEVETVVSYEDIPNFPTSTVAGHEGCFMIGRLGKVPVIVMKGRVHYYEGYDMQQVVMPIRLMRLLGAQTLILTNAAGGINGAYKPGTLVRITDQIASFVPSPLIGKNPDALGTRFPDMTEVYDKTLGAQLDFIAKEQNIPLQKGVYLQTSGPNYETPAEIRMYQMLGADLVGMSTACEAMAAKHAGMKLVGLSCVTNLAAGLSKHELNHAEVQETANRVAHDFETLLEAFIKSLG